MPRVDEYLDRLRHASAREVGHRVRRLLLTRRMQAGVARGGIDLKIPPFAKARLDALHWPGLFSGEDLAGQVDGCQPATLNLDPGNISAFEAQTAGRFFAAIDPRAAGIDIRQVWEPARLQHVVQMIVQSRATNAPQVRTRLLAEARCTVMQWLCDHPFLTGPHYQSPMECGLRIPVFGLVLKTAAGGSGRAYRFLWQAVYRHAWWVARNLSLYTSLGNHTICEAVGLVFAGAICDRDREGARWLHRGVQLLEDELSHQILPDGGPAEQSLAYHRFVVDLYCYAIDLLERNARHDCRRLTARIAKAENFLAAFDSGGRLPAIGDSDDGWAVAPGVLPRRPARQNRPCGRVTFKSAGYTVMRTETGVLVTFDHGPLGMAPLYNHGHADALAVTVTLNGDPFLIDPGTCRYNGGIALRRYFKGTRAHNTVTVDERDQAVQQSSFTWRHPFACRLTRISDNNGSDVCVEAEHDGYCRLDSHLIHRRRLQLTAGSLLKIRDCFGGSRAHCFDLHFHLHPAVQVRPIADGWRLATARQAIELTLSGAPDVAVVKGQIDPLLGWYSPAYGTLQECTVLRCRQQGRADAVQFDTTINFTPSGK